MNVLILVLEILEGHSNTKCNLILTTLYKKKVAWYYVIFKAHNRDKIKWENKVMLKLVASNSWWVARMWVWELVQKNIQVSWDRVEKWSWRAF